MAHVGQSTICGNILPKQQTLSRINPRELSRAAKFRLKFIEHYLTKTHSVTATCRHYYIARSLFYKWYRRYNPHNLSSLEDQSRKPHRVRTVTYDSHLVKVIRKLRQDYPSYSATKIFHLLARDYWCASDCPKCSGAGCQGGLIKVSISTIGRIISRFKLFFSRMVKARKHLSTAAKRGWLKRKAKQRKPYGLNKSSHTYQLFQSGTHLVEFDMKHIRLGNQRQYAFCGLEVYTKQAFIHIASTPSSHNARVALERILAILGKNVIILNDNGSENLGQAYDLLQTQGITQYFARPHTPKDKPYIENFIGKYQKECLDEDDGSSKTVRERQAQTNAWLNDYHFYRPHQALNYQTPDEFCATLGLTIPRLECL